MSTTAIEYATYDGTI